MGINRRALGCPSSSHQETSTSREAKAPGKNFQITTSFSSGKPNSLCRLSLASTESENWLLFDEFEAFEIHGINELCKVQASFDDLSMKQICLSR